MIVDWLDWAPATTFVAGAYVRAASKLTPGYAYLWRTAAGGLSGGAEPNWPGAMGLTIADNTVTWQSAVVAPYVDARQLERRIRPGPFIRLFSDQQNGFADRAAVLQVLYDASSYVAGFLGTEYVFPAGSPYPRELERITLDVAEAYANQRAPAVARKNATEMLATARSELRDLKAAVTRLDLPPLGTEQSAPSPAVPVAKNVGGQIADNSSRLVIDGANGSLNSGDF